MLIWPDKHFERFHDWKLLRPTRLEQSCLCGDAIDPRIIDDFDEAVWCSRGCFEEVALRCGLIKAKALVYERDRGVCAMCGADAGTATRVLERIRQVDRWDFRESYSENHERTASARAAAFLVLDSWGVSEETRSLWDADHIVPVVEGGGGCGLDNYRTLCVGCHRGETTQLAATKLLANLNPSYWLRHHGALEAPRGFAGLPLDLSDRSRGRFQRCGPLPTWWPVSQSRSERAWSGG